MGNYFGKHLKVTSIRVLKIQTPKAKSVSFNNIHHQQLLNYIFLYRTTYIACQYNKVVDLVLVKLIMSA